MADYLGSLVDRGLGRAETVRPRPAALFEPLPTSSGMAPVTGPDAEKGARTVEPGGLDSPQRARPTPPLERAAPRPILTEPAPRSTMAHQSTPLPQASVEPHALAPISVRPAQPDAHDESATAGSEERTPLQSVVALYETTPTLIPPARARPVAETVPGTQAVPSQITPAREAGQPPSAGSLPGSEPTSTIKVTIGRIEVRAVTPPARRAAPAKPTRSGPTLSLDDYLRQRQGGER
jgi:hypothetical protein